jgi:hypothetical protein
MDRDPTRVTEQPALTTSTGRSWLIVGGLFALVSLAVLIPLAVLLSSLAATVGAVVVGALYLAMVASRLLVRPGRVRLGVLACERLVMAAVALGAVFITAATAA